MTGGRPGQSYRLTAWGIDLFSKQYSWLSEILLTTLNGQLGSEGLQDLMSLLGDEVGAQVRSDTLGGSVQESLKSCFPKSANSTSRFFPGSRVLKWFMSNASSAVETRAGFASSPEPGAHL